LTLVVLVDQVIELVHFEDLIFLSNFKLGDIFIVQFNLTVDSDFLLVKNGLLCAQIIILAVNSALLLSTLNVLNLTSDPIFLHVRGLVIDLLDLLLDVVAHVLSWANKLITITASFQVSALTVQTIDLESLLLNLQKSLLDVLLDVHDIRLFFLELTNEIVKFLLQDLVLSRCVQVVKSDSGDLIGVVLDLHLLL